MVAQVNHFASQNLVLIGSSNGLLIFWCQGSTEKVLTDRQLDPQKETAVEYETKYKLYIYQNAFQNVCLTHWGRVTHICVGNLTIIGWDMWLVAWMAPSHYLNQCWNIVNWTPRSKHQWNFNRNSKFSFKKMYFKMLSAKWRPFCLGLNVLSCPFCWGLCVLKSHEKPLHILIIVLRPEIHSKADSRLPTRDT